MVEQNLFRRQQKQVSPLGNFFEKNFINQKLDNKVGYGVAAGLAVLFGVLIAKYTVIGLSLLAGLIGLGAVVICLLNTEVGLYINIFYSFFAFVISRYVTRDEFPVGVVTDILIFTTFLSLFIKSQNLRKNFNEFVRIPVVGFLLLFVAYLFLELFNPNGHAFGGWFQTFRRFFESVFLLFIAYTVFADYRSIKRFVTVIFIVSTIAGLYGCIQQWHGLFDFEIAWVMATENRFGLIFINGNYRKFSTMSDPTAYGVVMAACAIFFLILASNQKKVSTKLVLIGGSIFMLLGMAYSGTRTANAMVVIGIAMYILLTIDKKSTKVLAVLAGLSFMFLMYVPIYSNQTLNRFRSSFSASQDDSYKVREVNRAFIQPYIYKHPIGGGLGTTGGFGLRYSPNHFLAGFPPDSGYLKKALETGWIGLALAMILYFMILKHGIRGYFTSRRTQTKVLYGGIIATLFSFYIAEFAQEAIGQITDIVVYYPMVAILLKLRQIEQPRRDTGETV